MLYAAQDVECAFIETFGHATGIGLVAESKLRTRGLARLTARRPLRLVDLTGPGLARLRADNRLCTSSEIEVAQRWALALYRHPDQPDGLYYRARHDPSRFSVAIFDRAASATRFRRTGPLTAHRLASVLQHYDFGLIEDDL